MNSEDLQVSKQSLTFLIYRGQPQYQAFEEIKQYFAQNTSIHPTIEGNYKNLADQLKFDQIQLNAISKFIKEKGGLYQSEIYVQYFGDFINAYIQRIFQIQLLNLRILKTISKKNEFVTLIKPINNLDIYLSLLSTEQSLINTLQINELSTQIKFNNGKATLHSQDGIYKIGSNYQGWFGTHALVTCKNQDKLYLAYINLKNNNINEKWLGKTISNYHNFAISFNESEVIQYQEITQEDIELISEWQCYQGFEDTQICLRELLRLSDICYQYCSMRKQFKSTEDGQERSILTYQTTLIRLINTLSFSTMFYISTQEARKEFYNDVTGKKPRRKISRKFVDFFTLYVTEQSITLAEQLRDLFGGFGFLKVSGVPQIQEKLIWINSFYKNDRMKKQNDYLNVILDVENHKSIVLYYLGQYFMGNPELMIKELGQLTKSNVSNAFHVFGYHVARIKERLIQQNLQKFPYSSYQQCQLTFELFASQKFFGLLAFRRYRASNYILDRLLLNQNFISLSQMETSKDNISLIKNQATQNYLELLSVIHILINSFEFQHYGILIGEDDQKSFYDKLIYSSKEQNYRNTEQIVNEIRKPVLDLIDRSRL